MYVCVCVHTGVDFYSAVHISHDLKRNVGFIVLV